MQPVPKKIAERIAKGIKRFQPILNNSRARDDGEGDTVTIVTDMLGEIFGYDKYSEVTSEFAIKGTYCDIAIKIDGTLQTLVEVKAIGATVKDSHIKQAVDYAANQGVEWVALTNGINWKVFKVYFSKPIEHELVIDIDFCSLNPKNARDIELLYLWCKEGWIKSVLDGYYIQKQTLSRFYIGAIIQSEPVLKIIRQELRKISPDVKIDIEQVRHVITTEVIKREIFEGDKFQQAASKITRKANKIQKSKAIKPSPAPSEDSAEVA